MNNQIVMQIPMEKSLRIKAEKAASEIGFSSVQEIIRIFLHKLASKNISVNFTEEIILSKKAGRIYHRIDRESTKRKNLYQAENIDDLISQLHGNTLPRKLS